METTLSRRPIDYSTVQETNKRLNNDINRIQAVLANRRGLIQNDAKMKDKVIDLDAELKQLRLTIKNKETELRVMHRDHLRQENKQSSEAIQQKLTAERTFLEDKNQKRERQEDTLKEGLERSRKLDETATKELETVKQQMDQLCAAMSDLGPDGREAVNGITGKRATDDDNEELSKMIAEKEKLERKLLRITEKKDKEISKEQTKIIKTNRVLEEWKEVVARLQNAERKKEAEIRNLSLQLDGMGRGQNRGTGYSPLRRSQQGQPFYSNAPISTRSYIQDQPSVRTSTHLESLSSARQPSPKLEYVNLENESSEPSQIEGDEARYDPEPQEEANDDDVHENEILDESQNRPEDNVEANDFSRPISSSGRIEEEEPQIKADADQKAPETDEVFNTSQTISPEQNPI
ncbi:hypothetical protein BLNAU_8031 [Blattamonas nauphoetae]|uniref:Uncharacterized protein n=1 Tax=Blattamonas nauphoetae TaxID=2049346 RepID=A0ABQ9XZP6_9EUKA|nr:hypothetical protein BLNAU_8031 [Blattamonas nauphoetae]